MATYYVHPASWDVNPLGLTAGSSSGTGAVNSPWDLYTALVSKSATLAAGDVVWIRSGTYFFNANTYLPTIVAQTGSLYTVNCAGSPGSPIRFLSYPNENVYIDFNLRPTGSGVNASLADAPWPDRNFKGILFSGAGVHDIEFGWSLESDGNQTGFMYLYNSDTLYRNMVNSSSTVCAPPYTTNISAGESNRADRRGNCLDAAGVNIKIRAVIRDNGDGLDSFTGGVGVDLSVISYGNGWDAANDGVASTTNLFPTSILTDYGANVKASWRMDEAAGNLADSSGNSHTITTIGAGVTYASSGVLRKSGTAPPTCLKFNNTSSGSVSIADHADFQLQPSADWTVIVLLSMNSYTITAATNANPIEITTSATHNLITGDYVFIRGVSGNTNANGTRQITKVSGTKFTLDGIAGNGAAVLDANSVCAQARAPIIGKGDGSRTGTAQEWCLEQHQFSYCGVTYSFPWNSCTSGQRNLIGISYKHSTGHLHLLHNDWVQDLGAISSSTYATTTTNDLYFTRIGTSDTRGIDADRYGQVNIIKGSAITTQSALVTLWNYQNNGGATSTTTGRLAGHGLYLQTTTGGSKSIHDSVVWGNFGDGFHSDTSGSNPVVGFDVDGVHSYSDAWVFQSGGGAMQNNTFDHCYVYFTGTGGGMEFEATAAQTNTGNTIQNSIVFATAGTTASDAAVYVHNTDDVQFQGNIIRSGGSNSAIALVKDGGAAASSFHFGDTTANTYYTSNASPFKNEGVDQNLATWQATGGTFDPSSTVSGTLPASPTIVAKAHDHDTRLGLVAVYNWNSDTSVTITDATLRTTFGFASGDTIQIINTQNFESDTSVYSGPVGTSGVSVDMQAANRTKYTPIGDVGSYSVSTVYPVFGSFLVVRTYQAGLGRSGKDDLLLGVG